MDRQYKMVHSCDKAVLVFLKKKKNLSEDILLFPTYVKLYICMYEFLI